MRIALPRLAAGHSTISLKSVQPRSFDVLGVPISVTTLNAAAQVIAGWAGDQVGRYVIARDVSGVVDANGDPQLLAIHKDADMVVPDGMPLVWLGRLRGLPVSRTSGADLMDQLMARSEDGFLGHFLFGGKPAVAQTLSEKLSSRYPHARIVGFATPPFSELTDEELEIAALEIRRSGADIVWIGISSPKQEFLMHRLAPKTTATLIGVGAAFDYHSGAVARAPMWMQRSGLEWLHRLASEPRRLWPRYLVSAPRFILMLLGSLGR